MPLPKASNKEDQESIRLLDHFLEAVFWDVLTIDSINVQIGKAKLEKERQRIKKES